jgi:hypothetical protein
MYISLLNPTPFFFIMSGWTPKRKTQTTPTQQVETTQKTKTKTLVAIGNGHRNSSFTY